MPKLQNATITLDFVNGQVTTCVDMLKPCHDPGIREAVHISITGNVPYISAFSQALTLARVIENYAAVQSFLIGLPYE